MTRMYSLPNSRVRFREITPDDAYLVCRWRNTPSAREVFFSQDVVTPDSHRAFLAKRKPHDLIWIVELQPTFTVEKRWPEIWMQCAVAQPIGMLSLTVDVATRTGEYGRAYLAEEHRGHGYWLEIERTLEAFAFDVLKLESIWLEIFADNTRMVDIHLRGGWRIRAHSRPTVRNGRSVQAMLLDAATYHARENASYRVVKCEYRRQEVPPFRFQWTLRDEIVVEPAPFSTWMTGRPFFDGLKHPEPLVATFHRGATEGERW